MKWIYRLATIAMLLGAVALPFFISNKDGEPMLALPSSEDIIPDAVNEAKTAAIPGSGTTVFKWRDANGVWHYGDMPPENQTQVMQIQVDGNTNLIQGMKPEADASAPNMLAPANAPVAKQTPDDESLISLDRAMNIMNETKAAARMMENRNTQLNAIVGNSEQ